MHATTYLESKLLLARSGKLPLNLRIAQYWVTKAIHVPVESGRSQNSWERHHRRFSYFSFQLTDGTRIQRSGRLKSPVIKLFWPSLLARSFLSHSMGSWTPDPLLLDLTQNLPFTYPTRSISEVSNTEAFGTGINKRDKKRCVVCGASKSPGFSLHHCHIVPKIEDERVR